MIQKSTILGKLISKKSRINFYVKLTLSLLDLICDTDKSGVTMIQPEVKYNVLESMIKLYLQVQSFSLANEITCRQNAERKSKALRREIKKYMAQVDDE